jgi:hypothetical protein
MALLIACVATSTAVMVLVGPNAPTWKVWVATGLLTVAMRLFGRMD